MLDDDPSRIFPVQISGTASVGTLKKLIKDEQKHAFQHVDADDLRLFKVSFPVDDGLDAKLKRFDPIIPRKAFIAYQWLGVFEILSMNISMLSYYQCLLVSPNHCVATHPASSSESRSINHNLDLNCIVFGDDLSHVFTIDTVGSKNVGALRQAIKNEKKHASQSIR